MGLRRSSVGLAVAISCVVAAGCHAGSQAPRSTSAAGSALRDGFAVPTDSHLVGSVFDDVDQEEWTAVLDIERDPVGVYDQLVAQARRLRMALPGSGVRRLIGRPGCKPPTPPTNFSRTEGECRYDGSYCFVVRGMLACESYASRESGPALHVNVSLAWGGDTHHVVLTLGHSDSGPSERFGTTRLTNVVLPSARELPPVTIAGRAFGRENNAFERGSRRFTLEPGSRVLTDAPDAHLVVLEITGTATEVLARYAEQLATPASSPKVEVLPAPGGASVLRVGYSPFGGGAARLATDTSHRYLLVQYWSD